MNWVAAWHSGSWNSPQGGMEGGASCEQRLKSAPAGVLFVLFVRFSDAGKTGIAQIAQGRGQNLRPGQPGFQRIQTEVDMWFDANAALAKQETGSAGEADSPVPAFSSGQDDKPVSISTGHPEPAEEI